MSWYRRRMRRLGLGLAAISSRGFPTSTLKRAYGARSQVSRQLLPQAASTAKLSSQRLLGSTRALSMQALEALVLVYCVAALETKSGKLLD